MKKFFALFLVGMLLSMAGCDNSAGTPSTTDPVESNQAENNEQEGEPKELVIGRTYDATTLDVQNANDDGSYLLMYLAGEGLVRNDNGTITPGVAESWDVSDDLLTYTFHLRQDAKWADGSPLTAHDFEYSFKRAVNPELGLQQAESFFNLAYAEEYYRGEATVGDVGVVAQDDYTLVLTCAEPDLAMLHTLATYVWMPVKQSVVEEAGAAYGAEADKVMFNGPFTITEWAHEDKVVMEKNENYWNKDAVCLDKITNKVGVAETTAVDMMLAGELDVYNFTDINNVNSLTGNGYKSKEHVNGYQFAHMNWSGSSEETAPFMQNTNFRRALNYAVNREGLTASVYQGAEPATRLTSPNTMGVNGLFNEEYPYEGWSAAGDPEKAKECLDLALQELEATLEDVPELSLLCFESQSSTTVMQAIQDMLLSTLGIKSKIDPQPIQQMLEKSSSGDWDLWWGGKAKGPMDWASEFKDFKYTEPYTKSFIQYRNDEFSAWYDKALRAMTVQERKDSLFECEKIFCEDPPSILVGWTTSWVVMREDVTGFMEGADVTFTYLDIN